MCTVTGTGRPDGRWREEYADHQELETGTVWKL